MGSWEYSTHDEAHESSHHMEHAKYGIPKLVLTSSKEEYHVDEETENL